jgi:hypothetical protein
VECICGPSCAESINRKAKVQDSPSINARPYSKAVYGKKGWEYGSSTVLRESQAEIQDTEAV